MKNNSIYSWVLALVHGYILYLACYIVGSFFLSSNFLSLPPIVANHVLQHVKGSLWVFTVLLGFLLALRGFRGSFFVEWSFLAFLMYVLGCLLSTFEAPFLATLLGRVFLVALFFFPVILCVSALSHILKTRDPLPDTAGEKPHGYFLRHSPKPWVWRLAMAWMVYPVVFFLFGMVVAPIAAPLYEELSSWLVLPLGLAIHYQMEEEC